MSAGIADMLPGRLHYLFDSYEGLPPAKEIDGEAAKSWQNDRELPIYYDNCRAEKSFADTAMRMSAAKDFQLVQGWFCDTIPGFIPAEPIAVLHSIATGMNRIGIVSSTSIRMSWRAGW